MIFALAMLGGRLAGLAIPLSRHSLECPVRSVYQVRDELGLRSLGEIPKIRNIAAKPMTQWSRRMWAQLARRTSSVTTNVGAFKEVTQIPYSPFREGIRRIKTTISLTPNSEKPRRIGVISALPKEGKSTVAANLASVYAAGGVRTLLVDADIRSGTLTENFAPHSTRGITSILTEDVTPETIIINIPESNLDLLPAGAPHKGVIDFPGGKMAQLLDTLSQTYSVIITPMALLHELSLNLRAAQAHVLVCIRRRPSLWSSMIQLRSRFLEDNTSSLPNVHCVLGALWGDDRGVNLRHRVRLSPMTEDDNDPILLETEKQLNEYFAGNRQSFSVILDYIGTPFQQKVWKSMLAIPFGETRSYCQLAEQIGSPKAVRAVGAANGKNPISIIGPCHRVVGASGQLRGFAMIS